MTHTAWYIHYDSYLTYIFRQFATNVSLYPLLWDDEINNGLSLSNLISLCSHENNDIAAAVIQTLYELVDQVNFGFGFPWPSRQMLSRGWSCRKGCYKFILGRIGIWRTSFIFIEKIYRVWSSLSRSWMHEKIWWKCYGRTRRTLYMFPACWIRYGRVRWSQHRNKGLFLQSGPSRPSVVQV